MRYEGTLRSTQTNQDITVRRTLTSVYAWMSTGVATSAVAAYLILATGLYKIMSTGFQIILFVASIGLVFAINAGVERFQACTLKALFFAYSILMGFIFASLALIYPIGQVVSVFFAAALAFVALAAIGATVKKDLSFMSTFLIMGVFMLLGLSLINLFTQSHLLYELQSWMGVLVFSGLTAWDSQRIKQSVYALSKADNQTLSRYKIFHAVTMYLNFINLFIYMLRIVGGGRRD
jgi:uncharacterized protein